MGLNSTPSGERIQIGIFGRRNAGKSSLMNALTNQSLAIVSEQKGTTTDPVSKAMELLPLGAVVLIDTAGLDDKGELGVMRVEKAWQVLNKIDIALLVIDGTEGETKEDQEFLSQIQKRKLPYLIVLNKADQGKKFGMPEEHLNCICVSAMTGQNIEILKERLGKLVPERFHNKPLVGDLIAPFDLVVLVVPIDSAAPKGRLILPQQQMIRDILETGAVSIVVRDTEYQETLRRLEKKPSLVITDSQVFEEIAAQTPMDIRLTSFSVLFARYKGNLMKAVQGAKAIEMLKDGDTVLIAEGCTHHRQCDDIGTVKIPRWIQKYTGKQIQYKFCSGTEFPKDLTAYKMILHCGGCTLNEKEMQYRIQCAIEQEIPITNYGIFIAYIKGILERSIELFS